MERERRKFLRENIPDLPSEIGRRPEAPTLQTLTHDFSTEYIIHCPQSFRFKATMEEGGISMI